MDRQKENGTENLIFTEGVGVRVPHDVSEEVVLPDYLPPIGRIIAFSAAALDENRFFSPPSLEASGMLACSVTYAGDGGEIVSYPFNCDFSVRVPVGDAGDAAAPSFFVRTDVESPVCRATAPRKVSLSAKLLTTVFSVKEEDVSPSVEEDGGSDTDGTLTVEYLTVPVSSSGVRFLKKTGETEGELPAALHGENGEETKVINCSGVSYVTGVSAAPGSVSVRGETVVSCLVTTPDGEYTTVVSKAPFEETLLCDPPLRADAEVRAAAFVRCASVNVSDTGGGRFVFSAEHDVDAELWQTAEAGVAADAYSTEYVSDVGMKETAPVRFLGGCAATFTATGSGRLPGNGGRAVLQTGARVSGGSATVTEDGRLVFTGQCTVTAVLSGDGRAEPADVTFPLKFESVLSDAPGGGKPTVRWDAAVISADARPDGERLNVTAEIAVSAAATLTEKMRTVGKIRLNGNEPIPRKRSSVRVFFPDGEMTEWDVARRFCADPDDVTVLRGGDRGAPLPRGSAVIIDGR